MSASGEKSGPPVRAVAEAIIARARQAGVSVHESPQLVATLSQFDLDDRVPPALYVAVAEVLAWAYRVEHGPPLG